ncbi:MAG: hypothetical protein VW147_00010 [Bacteroidota bacterium]
MKNYTIGKTSLLLMIIVLGLNLRQMHKIPCYLKLMGEHRGVWK